MSTVVWDGLVAGPLYSDNFLWPNPSAYSNGAGVITVTQAVVTMDIHRLEIRNCSSLVLPTSCVFSATSASATQWGEVAIYGACDIHGSGWGNLGVYGNHAGALPKLELYDCLIRQATSGFAVVADVGSASCEAILRVRNCTFMQNLSGCIRGILGEQTRGPVDIRECQFIACNTDGDIERNMLFFTSVTAGAKVVVDHCSSLFRALQSSGRLDVIKMTDNVELTLSNNILTQQNTDAVQTSRVLQIGGSATCVNHHNFIYTYIEAQDLGSLVLGTGDQAVDPGYYSSACASPDLRPTSLAGTPDLWQADSIGWYPGILEPHDLVATLSGTAYAVAPLDQECVYAGVKQRVYEGSFATQVSKAQRGRAVRMRVRFSDQMGNRLIAGIWVDSVPEPRK